MIKAVIFDMGGVILRTIDYAPREGMAQRFGCSRAELEKFVFLSATSVLSEVGKLSDIDHWRAVLEYFNQSEINAEEAYDEFFSGDAINQELLEYARSLKPKRRIGLLSNAWENTRQRLEGRYGFINDFDISIFSAEVGKRKPDEDIFMLALEKLNVKPKEAIFIDDFVSNVRGAQNAGLHAILFESNEQVIAEVNRLINQG